MAAIKQILVADDHNIIRDRLHVLLGHETDLRIAACVACGPDAVRAAGAMHADLVITDIVAGTNGAESIAQIKRDNPEVRILVLTCHTDDAHLFAALNAGADGYVLKSDMQQELLAAVRSLLAGKIFLSPAICDRVVDGYLGNRSLRTQTPRAATADLLTKREREVLKLIAAGHRTRDIAALLALSPKTIEKHRGNLMCKLELGSTAAATAYAFANGLVQP